MREKYAKVGLDYDQILEKFPNIQEYEEAANAYFSDSFFEDIKKYLDDEDYELAKDAIKGLFVLAEELRMYPLYYRLVDVYDDLDEELYKEAYEHYDDAYANYQNIKGVFHA